MGRDPPEMPSPYEPPEQVNMRPLGSWGVEPASPPAGGERLRQWWRRLRYGGMFGWPGQRVQWCYACEAERGFTSSLPPPPAPRPAAFGPDPSLARNRPAEKATSDSPYAAFRQPEQSLQRVEWVRCVVCGTVVMDQSEVYKAHYQRRRLARAGEPGRYVRVTPVLWAGSRHSRDTTSSIILSRFPRAEATEPGIIPE